MDITGLNKAEVLAALYNNAKAQGFGIFIAEKRDMTIQEAEEILSVTEDKFFDYLKGRVMKINLAKDEVDTRLYNRDNGVDAAEMAIKRIVKS